MALQGGDTDEHRIYFGVISSRTYWWVGWGRGGEGKVKLKAALVPFTELGEDCRRNIWWWGVQKG